MAEQADAVPGRRFDAVVFDFGGVLISPITTRLAALAEHHGIGTVEMLEMLMGPRYVSTADHPWHRAERGEVSANELQGLLEPLAEAAGVALRGDEMEILFDRSYRYNQAILDRVRALRQEGYRTALLTNSVREFQEVLKEEISGDLFDEIVDSSEVGMRKPEPEIYRVVIDRLGVDPRRTVYLDDFEHNLGPAREVGWTVVHVTDPEQALACLDELLTGTDSLPSGEILPSVAGQMTEADR